MIRILTDKRIDTMKANVVSFLKDQDYVGAAQQFMRDASYYVDKGIVSGQYNYDSETGRISRYHSIRWYDAPVFHEAQPPPEGEWSDGLPGGRKFLYEQYTGHSGQAVYHPHPDFHLIRWQSGRRRPQHHPYLQQRQEPRRRRRQVLRHPPVPPNV